MKNISFIRSYSPNLSELYTISLLRDAFNVKFFMGTKPAFNSDLIHKYRSLNDVFKYIPNSDFFLKLSSYNGIIAPVLNLKSILEKHTIYNISDATYYHSYQLAKQKSEYDLKLVMNRWETIPFNYRRTKIMSNISKEVLNQLDGIINITPLAEQASNVEGVSIDKSATIPCIVDTEEFHPREKPVDLCEKYHIQKDDFVLLFVGKLAWNKGIFDLLYALKLLTDDTDINRKKIKLLILGKGKEAKRIDSLSLKLGLENNIITTGYVPFDQMKHYYNLSDVFLLLSQATKGWNEQFGFSVVEAMASGLPVVVNSSGALHYVTKSAGVNVPVGDFYEAYRKLKQMILDKSIIDGLREESLRVIESFYIKDVIMPKLINFYQEL